MANEFVSLDVLAIRLNLPRTYLRQLVREGRIPVLTAGRLQRFDPEQVREALRNLAETVVHDA